MKLQDYAPYYIGSPCLNTWFPADHDCYNAGWKLIGIETTSFKPYILESDTESTRADLIKLVLRSLEDMTKGEAIDFMTSVKPGAQYIDHNKYAVLFKSQGSMGDISFTHGPPAGFHYLLQQGFDLFGLIPAGLAVDAKTIQPQKDVT